MTVSSGRRCGLSCLVLAGVAGVYYLAPLSERPSAARAFGGAAPQNESRVRSGAITQRGAAALVTSRPARAPLAGQVQAQSGVALAGVAICTADAKAKLEAAMECAFSDENGNFVLQELDFPRTIFASRAGYVPLTKAIGPAIRGGPLVLVMQAGGARVMGSVLDALGGPIAGAWLCANSSRDGTRVVGFSDEAGHFRLDVATGEHQVVARAEGYARQELLVSAPSEGLSFVLAAGSAIVGRVVSQDSRAPIADLSVRVWGIVDGLGTASRVERSGEDGRFVINELAPGAYSLQAVSDRWYADEHQVSLGLSEVSEWVELILRPATQLCGTVLVAGVPCDKGWVELSGAVRMLSAVDDQGHVAFDGIPRGRYEVTLACEGALAEKEPIDVGLARVTRVWDLKRGLRVTGVALTSAGRPAAGLPIDVSPRGEPSDRVGSSCTTDEQGEFSCSGLVAGEYDCTIGPGTPPRGDSVPVAVSAGSPSRVTLHLHAQAAIRARVNAVDGFDRRALVLLAKRRDGATTIGEFQGDAFVFAPLALGSYEVALESGPADSHQHVELTREGQVVELSLSVPGPHTLSGRVVDDRGHGLPDTWVRASGASVYGRLGSPVLTDAAGDFSLKGLVPGKYRLEVNSGYGQGELDDVASDTSGAVVHLGPIHE